MSDVNFRTDRELDLEQRDAESHGLYTESERTRRIRYWLQRFKTYEQACALAETEIALAEGLKEETPCRHAA